VSSEGLPEAAGVPGRRGLREAPAAGAVSEPDFDPVALLSVATHPPPSSRLRKATIISTVGSNTLIRGQGERIKAR